MEFIKMVMITLYVRQQKRHSLLDSVGEGKGGMIWENDIETCIISYVKRIARPGSMHDTRCLGLVHWDDPEGMPQGTFMKPANCLREKDSVPGWRGEIWAGLLLFL